MQKKHKTEFIEGKATMTATCLKLGCDFKLVGNGRDIEEVKKLGKKVLEHVVKTDHKVKYEQRFIAFEQKWENEDA